MTDIDPNLHTLPEDFSGAEKAKMSTRGLTMVVRDVSSPANLHHQFRDTSFQDLADVAETLAKSYGIYLEFNRAKTGSEKNWMYMLRISVPGGGPITGKQWTVLDDVADKYTQSDSYTGKSQPSLRVTTRQNIQLHWVKKENLVDTVREIAKSGFYTINGCGDNTRNVMGCPLSTYSKVFNANEWAQKVGKYFRLPTAAYLEIFEIDPSYLRDERGPGEKFEYGMNLLNRKFKIAFSALHRDEDTGEYQPDNCVELRTNDIGVAPILNGEEVDKFQVYIGGGQGEKAGHPTFAAQGSPLGIFSKESLMDGLDAVVKIHQEWGDRKNRYWSRLKYVVFKMGMKWYRDQVSAKGVQFAPPEEGLDYGPRQMHYGWKKQETDGKLSYGTFLETGRIIDGGNGQLKKMVRHMMETYPSILLFTTPNQDILFTEIGEGEREDFESELRGFGYGARNGRAYSTLRTLSGACVGRDTCRLTYTDSEKFEPYLIDELEQRWGHLSESIGVTGCERQCFRPATKTIGWVGTGLNLYAIKIGGTEDGRHQGGPLIDSETQAVYLHFVPRKDVARVTNALFEFHVANASSEEASPGGMGYFFRRVGAKGIIDWLKKDPVTAEMMKKTVKNPLSSEPALANPSLLSNGGDGSDKRHGNASSS